MRTHFAPTGRASEETLRKTITNVSCNPVVDSLMKAVSGLLAVLNEQRQVLAVNDELLAMLGLKEARSVLGLRPGEMVGCIHAHKPPDGCGTTRFCSTCGAAIAIVTSFEENAPQRKDCSIRVQRNGKTLDLFFHVQACPITFEQERFLLLFLQDITLPQRRAALERAFFHDINNLVQALSINAQLMKIASDQKNYLHLAGQIQDIATQLSTEVAVQRALTNDTPHSHEVHRQQVPLSKIFERSHTLTSQHPAAIDKTLQIARPNSKTAITTDLALLIRVINNMLINAFEATEAGGTIKLWAETDAQTITFCVWNRQAIPPTVARRVFQRNFTTKEGEGRGIGTYTMKLLGEHYLDGHVTFTSTEEAGTTFRIRLPRA